ncbi:TIGR03557 family F420-dependent LLM class oxidoreductase [Dactylosporangium sucinum]|uniref:LLM class F420-dependent oxidoreductase n=1 Tax=Dactylosporangium sucinum TaxID=1424081 RepID=A0A917UC32_9ACTN|nr:TIGR03557 family F420-dependent LLM class oxidoreductase [Dactylosporangium sucinum]GGM79135.1 LLM class F420-dependent oxidoreductase [Dactylosporangium sucinum]
MKLGYFLSSEEYTPAQLVEQARLAQDAGFEGLWISDHYHPWNDEQGQSPLVWSMIGALSQMVHIPVTTAVTCPIMRIHPAVIAQAAATSAVLLDGRFVLGVGTGEALNEHIYGDAWPGAGERLGMLEEAVHVMRELWEGGVVSHRGKHFTVEQARVYTRPETPPKVYMSAFGPKAIGLAGDIADGFISVVPNAEHVEQFRKAGGAGKPVQGGFKGCWAPSADEAVQIAHRLWPNAGLPGELSQVLPSPRHFEQASQLVTPSMVRDAIACGPDPDRHASMLRTYEEAGFDEVYVAPVGPHYRELIDLYRKSFLP